MGKTRDLFKKIRDTKGTFHAKMGLIKDINGMDLTEAGDSKKRWQEYTEELYQKNLIKIALVRSNKEVVRRGGKNTQEDYTLKSFNCPDDHNGVITHLQPDILECEVKWALEASLQKKLVDVMEF